MYKKFLTEGLVLGKYPTGEANVSVLLFTKELGLLRATARSARAERSKLRYGLEPFTRGAFSLIRGKNEWRLAGIDRGDRALLLCSSSRRRSMGRIARLLLRLIQGEEVNVPLYKDVTEGFLFLINAQSEVDAASIECMVVLRILSRLGYLSQTPEITQFLEGDFSSLELTAQAALSRAHLVQLINDSLSASGL